MVPDATLLYTQHYKVKFKVKSEAIQLTEHYRLLDKVQILIEMNSDVVGNRSRGRPEGSLFNSYYTEVEERALFLSLDCSTLSLIVPCIAEC